MSAIRRTDAEIAMRVAELKSTPHLATVQSEIEELIFALPYKEAKLYLPDDTTEREWEGNRENTESIYIRAAKHLGYAIQAAVQRQEAKAVIAVGRFRAWTWLTEPELYLGVIAAPEGTYLTGTLRAAALALGLADEWEARSAALPTVRLMADGLTS